MFFDKHDIISITTESLLLKNHGESDTLKKNKKSKGIKSGESEGSAITFSGFIKFILAGAICVIGFTFARTYAKRNRGLYIAGIEVMNAYGGVGSFSSRHRF